MIGAIVMEHRWSDRVFSSLDVLLVKNDIPVVSCKASNIGLYGMFVKTGPVRYARNSVLDVEFPVSTKERQKKTKRVPVYVVHQSEDGLGLAFRDESPETIGFVKKLIQNITNTKSIRTSLRNSEAASG
jgi:hypothetical protein